MNLQATKIIDVKLSIGELVRNLRKRDNLSQDELAALLNITRGTIKNLEHGKNINIDTLLKVLQHFDLLTNFSEYVTNQKSNVININSLY